jgi:hypothetical protein
MEALRTALLAECLGTPRKYSFFHRMPQIVLEKKTYVGSWLRKAPPTYVVTKISAAPFSLFAQANSFHKS